MCTRKHDIYSFVHACDIAVGLIEENNATTLVKFITTWLTGRALEIFKYKNVSKWPYYIGVKSYLTDTFKNLSTALTLQIQLNSIRMCNEENVNEYCL